MFRDKCFQYNVSFIFYFSFFLVELFFTSEWRRWYQSTLFIYSNMAKMIHTGIFFSTVRTRPEILGELTTGLDRSLYVGDDRNLYMSYTPAPNYPPKTQPHYSENCGRVALNFL